MTDEGQWILNEPFKTQLMECKTRATQAWLDEVYSYLDTHTAYSFDQLSDEFDRRIEEKRLPAVELVDAFVIEALEGSL